eukprot:352965-Chlamydomonas_euryale.AAC.29
MASSESSTALRMYVAGLCRFWPADACMQPHNCPTLLRRLMCLLVPLADAVGQHQCPWQLDQ